MPPSCQGIFQSVSTGYPSISLISCSNAVEFSVGKSFASLNRCIHRYFMVRGAIVNKTIFLINYFLNLLLRLFIASV